jgi:hypothetical protein
MALYKVSRTDDIQPGEFVDGYVIAGGTAQARGAVAHMEGVTPNGSNVVAQRMGLTDSITVLSAYFDERAPQGDADENYPYDDMIG